MQGIDNVLFFSSLSNFEILFILGMSSIYNVSKSRHNQKKGLGGNCLMNAILNIYNYINMNPRVKVLTNVVIVFCNELLEFRLDYIYFEL